MVVSSFNDYIKYYKSSPIVDMVPISQSEALFTGNPHLWNGQLILLNSLLGDTVTYPNTKFKQYFKACEVVEGLYTRFPKDMEATRGFDAISFDELNGIAFGDGKLAQEICSYGFRNGWVFDELRPNYRPKFSFKDYLGAFKTVVAVVKKAFETKKFGGSNEIDKIIMSNEVTTFYSRKMLPSRRYVWKVCAGIKPSLLDKIHFLLNANASISSPKTSGKNMHLFILIKLHLMGKLDKDSLVKRVMLKFLKKVDHVGNAKRFYPEGHPFIPAIEQAVEKLKKELL